MLFLAVGILLYFSFPMWSIDGMLRRLLEDSRNRTLNTTEEKNGRISYQIVNGCLYYEEYDEDNEKSGIYEYDYDKNEKRKLWEGKIDDFKIMDGKIYYGKWKSSKEAGLNRLDVECRELENIHSKEKLIEGVSEYVFSGDTIYFSRIVGKKRCIYQYDLTSANCKEINFFDQLDQDGDEIAGDMILASGNSLIFEENENDGIISYDVSTNQWNECFQVDLKKEEWYFLITGIQAKEDFLYIEVRVCDRTKPVVFAPHIVKDAVENGIWRVNISTGQQIHLTNTLYDGGIYMLDGILYGIDYGKCEEIDRV